jgi:threonine/homoserine/homoserine lactone efflux protein
MVSLDTLGLFIAATLAVNLSPGPSVFYVSSVASSRGLGYAAYSVAGMSVGIFLYVLAAATGLSALLATSDTLYFGIRYIGAAYLAYMGWTILTPPKAPAQSKEPVLDKDQSKLIFFYRGILVDLLNPKIGLFFLAFFPQFVSSTSQGAFIQTILLGFVFIVIGAGVNLSYAIIAARASNSATGRLRQIFQRWLPGAVLFGLAARLLLLEE